MPTTRRARLRQIPPSEIHEADAFWQEHRSEFLQPRPLGVLYAAAQKGGIFALELAGRIVACSATLPREHLPLVELSDTLVVSPFRGFRLQPRLLTPVRVAQALMAEHGAEIAMIIDRNNATSMRNCKSSGFFPWAEPPLPVLETMGLAGPGGAAGYELLRLPAASAWHGVAELLQRLGTGTTLTLRRGPDVLEVELELVLFRDTDARTALEKAAAGALPRGAA
jgi:hypothetical protein